MANTVSAKKMTRKIAKRTAVNRSRRSRMRTFVRKVEEAIAAGDQSNALTALRVAEPEMMRAAQHGIVHKNNASRKVSRLAARGKALAARTFRHRRDGPEPGLRAGLFHVCIPARRSDAGPRRSGSVNHRQESATLQSLGAACSLTEIDHDQAKASEFRPPANHSDSPRL